MSEPNDVFPSKLAIAEHFEVSERTIFRWSNYDDWPESPTPVTVAEFINRNCLHGAEGEPMALAVAKSLLIAEQIRKLRLANDLTESRLVDRKEVELAWAEMCLSVKADIEAIPDQLEMLFPQAQRAALTLEVRQKIFLILKRMAEEPPSE